MTVEFDGLEQDCCVGSTILMMLRYKHNYDFKFEQFKKFSKKIQKEHNLIYKNYDPVESQYGFDIVPVELMTELKFKLEQVKLSHCAEAGSYVMQLCYSTQNLRHVLNLFILNAATALLVTQHLDQLISIPFELNGTTSLSGVIDCVITQKSSAFNKLSANPPKNVRVFKVSDL
ncbi:MAG: hypothetical protein ACON35_08495 [Candidatus Marinamargulisbacteria bacterium]